jgi:hypothetical protein
MPQTSVRADVHQAFDVHLHALAEVALNLALRVKDGANATKLIFAQIFNARINLDLRLFQDRSRTRASDTVNVCEANLRALIRRKINTSYTSHNLFISDFGFRISDLRRAFAFQTAFRNQQAAFLSSLSLFMLRVSADHAHHAFAVDDLAVVTHFFD